MEEARKRHLGTLANFHSTMEWNYVMLSYTSREGQVVKSEVSGECR